jgi:hypothetical protein
VRRREAGNHYPYPATKGRAPNYTPVPEKVDTLERFFSGPARKGGARPGLKLEKLQSTFLTFSCNFSAGLLFFY